jgi:ribosomal protein S18 acetylase RimI-like enzyme
MRLTDTGAGQVLAMSDITIGHARDADLGEILRDYERFWGDRTLPRYLHHPMFVYEFGDTAFVARRADGQIVGYLLGFVAPTGDGYIHFVAVRDDARGRGLARQLYEVFAVAAAERGATALKAITGPQNEGSISFHRKLGFKMTHVDNYGGTGRARLIMRRPLAGFPLAGQD